MIKLCHDSSFNEGLSLIAYLLWQIWKNMNLWVFSGISSSPLEIWTKVESSFYEFSHSSVCTPHYRLSTSFPLTPSWIPTSEGWIKINCDASVDVVSGLVGAVTVMCDLNGFIVGGDSKILQSSSINCAEAMALRLGVKLAVKHNLYYVCFESNNKSLINRLVNKSLSRWLSASIEEDILHDVRDFDDFICSFVSRSCNVVVDWVARNTRLNTCPVNWYISIPQDLQHLL
ncbi:hypothetical protein GQ457_12G009480 [Hibiscus cannabinus]